MVTRPISANRRTDEAIPARRDIPLLLAMAGGIGLAIGCDDTREVEPPPDQPGVEIRDGDVDVDAPGVRVRVRDRTDNGGVDVDIDDRKDD